MLKCLQQKDDECQEKMSKIPIMWNDVTSKLEVESLKLFRL